MSYRHNLTIIAQVFASAERLGATIPKALNVERKKLTELAEKVDNFHPSSDLSSAVLDALENDRDVLTDERVRAAATAQLISNSTNLPDLLGRRAGALVHDNVDVILGSLEEPFNAAAEKVNVAVARLGGVDLDNTTAVLSRGGDAAQNWADAQAGSNVILEIRNCWKQLSAAAPRLLVDRRWSALMIADIEPSAFLEEKIAGWLNPLEVVARGFTLSYATPDVLSQRIAALQNHISERAVWSANAGQRAFARHHGMGESVVRA